MTKEERQHWIDRWNSLKNKNKALTNQDKVHLQWIHDRIVNVYGENENLDFLIRLRKIIKTL